MSPYGLLAQRRSHEDAAVRGKSPDRGERNGRKQKSGQRSGHNLVDGQETSTDPKSSPRTGAPCESGVSSRGAGLRPIQTPRRRRNCDAPEPKNGGQTAASRDLRPRSRDLRRPERICRPRLARSIAGSRAGRRAPARCMQTRASSSTSAATTGRSSGALRWSWPTPSLRHHGSTLLVCAEAVAARAAAPHRTTGKPCSEPLRLLVSIDAGAAGAQSQCAGSSRLSDGHVP